MDLKHPDDKQFNAHKQHSKMRREARISVLEHAKDGKARVMYDVWEANRHPRSMSKTRRLCRDGISLLKEHLASFKGSHDGTGRGKCVVCNKRCYWKCRLCPGVPRMCLKEEKGGNKLGCTLDWHNNNYFGICKPDQVKYFNETQAKYRKPTATEVRKNAAHVKTFRVKKLLKSNGST